MTEPLLRTLRALVVRPEAANRVVSGPYDAYSAEERRAITAAEPLNYLNVTRTIEDLAEGETEEDLVGEARAAMVRLLAADVYRAVDEPSLFLYELSYRDRVQLGLVGLVPVDAFADGRILKHEDFRPERAMLLARHLRATGATSSPISLSFRSWPEIESTMADLAAGPPILEHHRADIGQRVWAVSGRAADLLSADLQSTTLYITDGHHRVAAATLARKMGRESDEHGELDWALAVVFPDSQLRVTAFHRLVVDRRVRSAERLLADLDTVGLTATEVPSAEAATPEEPGRVGMYLAGRWFSIDLAAAAGPRALDGLDVQRFQVQILEPVFGVRDPGSDPALTHLPGMAGIDGFVERCHQEPNTVGFLLYRTAISELFAVADEGELMPPKSSYFTPKPLSGVFIRSLGWGPLSAFGPSAG